MKERIKLKRKEQGYTQRQLGGIVGVASANVSFWEQGINKPSTSNMKKLADALNVSVDWLEHGNKDSARGSNEPLILAWELPDDVDLAGIDVQDIMVPSISSESGERAVGEIDHSNLCPAQRKLLQLYSLQPKYLAALPMQDTSMEPSIAKGDTLFVDTSVKTIERDAKRIYAMVKDDDTLVVCRADEDALSRILWVDSRGQQSALTIHDAEWSRYKIIGRVVMRTAVRSF